MALVNTPVKSAAAPAAPAPWSEETSLFEPAEMGIDKLVLFLYGPPKAGKSLLASTVGAPDGTDVIYIMADSNGAISIRAAGKGAPYTIDLQKLHAQGTKVVDMPKLLSANIAGLMAKYPERKFSIVFDGITIYNTWITDECPKSGDGKPEWSKFTSLWLALFDTLNKFQCHKIFISHAKMDVGDVRDKEKTADARLATGATDGEVIKPDITGAALGVFFGQSDIFGFVCKEYDLKGQEQYVFYPDGGDKARGGTRFAKYLPKKILNGNLRETIENLKKAVAADAQ